MIQSMTAFSRAQTQGSWGSAVCELRSINHRYLEIFIRSSESLHGLEVLMRERIREFVKRGKIECHMRYVGSDNLHTDFSINTNLVAQLTRANEKIGELLVHDLAPINPLEVLRWPGVLQVTEIEFETIQDEILNLLEKALKDLVAAREREGEELNKIFLQRLDEMKIEVDKARTRIPTILNEQREKLMTRFRDAKLELDSNRLEQEMVMFAQKIDVTEEIERIDTHISEVRRVLKQGGVVGRRLDFLMQELNREANTLGSKSVDLETTRVSVELKVLIEQIREQVQNVE